MNTEKQITKEQAIQVYESRVWQSWTYEQKVRFQLFQDRLAMPFDVFHEAIEKVLGRGVFTHEFAFRDSLILEYLGEKPAPTFDEIIGLIPADKLNIIVRN
jgi:hypothetical protein